MPQDFDPATIAAMESKYVGRFVFLFRFFLDSGTLNFTTSPNGITYDGVDYTYVGAIGGLTNIEESDDLTPSDYAIEIGSCDTDVIATFAGEEILNRECVVYQAITDDSQDIVGEPWIYFRGLLDPPSISDDSVESVMGIPVRDILSDWDRNIESRYTDSEQRRLYEGDFCLENVSSLASKVIIWPNEKWYS